MEALTVREGEVNEVQAAGVKVVDTPAMIGEAMFNLMKAAGKV